MIRVNAYNLLYDFRDFVRANRIKLLFLWLACIAGIILGICGAFSVFDAQVYLTNHADSTFLFVIGKKSIVGYFFVNLIISLLTVLLLAFLSVHFLASYLSFLVLFFRSYVFSLYLCLYIMLLKLSVLPFVLLCLIPYYLLSVAIFTVVAVLALNRACDLHLYGYCNENSLPRFVQKLILPCIMLVILLILFTILSYFLTVGIIL